MKLTTLFLVLMTTTRVRAAGNEVAIDLIIMIE